MRLIKVCHRSDISEIKLKRTDTTLDLSQKALHLVSKIRNVGGGFVLTRELRKGSRSHLRVGETQTLYPRFFAKETLRPSAVELPSLY